MTAWGWKPPSNSSSKTRFTETSWLLLSFGTLAVPLPRWLVWEGIDRTVGPMLFKSALD